MPTASSPHPVIGSDPFPPRGLERIVGWLPRGGQLPEDVWWPRHRIISLVLWLHVPLLVIVGLVNDRSVLQIAVDTGSLVACGAMALIVHRRSAKSAFVSLGLLCASASLVHLTGGLTDVHFHFFVMLGLVALYQEWTPYLMAVLFVVLHHTIIGLVWPDWVYSEGAGRRRPFIWSIVHASFVLGQIAVQVTVWKFLELYQDRVARLERDQLLLQQANVELQLEREREKRERAEEAVYKLSHWRDLDPRRAGPPPGRRGG